jgi:hypothetical protein
MIPITWPFAVWGLDMVGPFRRSKKKHTHLLVAVDKFTKWVEAEPVSRCDAATSVKFLKKLIYCFGYPHSIITDNGTNLSKGVTPAHGAFTTHVGLLGRRATRSTLEHTDYSQ